MIHTLENNTIKVLIHTLGAELKSIYNKETNLEYLWNADPNYWGKTSPVLFPIIGSVKNDAYEFEGNTYNLNRHGFAREKEFEVESSSASKISFVLNASDETLPFYPFNFKLTLEYFIEENQLFCTYKVENKSSKTIYFSVGAHPAFAIPLTENTSYDDWHLEFNQKEHCGIYPLSAEGLTELESIPFFDNNNKISLRKDLFNKDALIFKELKSNAISIASTKSQHGVCMQFPEFKYFGIWSTKQANFVCLEPWCGIADHVASTGKIEEKEGINSLQPNEIFNATWSVKVY